MNRLMTPEKNTPAPMMLTTKDMLRGIGNRARLNSSSSCSKLFGGDMSKLDQETYISKLEVVQMQRYIAMLETRVDTMKHDMEDKVALHEYAAMIRKAAPCVIDSQYLLRVQAQMCRSLHKMGAMENQITVMKNSTQEIVKSLQADIVEIVNDKCNAELYFMNELTAMQKAMIDMKDEYEERLSSKDETIRILQEQLLWTRKSSAQRGHQEIGVLDESKECGDISRQTHACAKSDFTTDDDDYRNDFSVALTSGTKLGDPEDTVERTQTPI